MKLEQIIAIADAAYPDGMVQQAFDANKDRGVEDELATVGDGLAEFIARELTDTYDSSATDDEQLTEAARCMTSARNEMDAVVIAFYKQKPELFNA